MQAILNTLQTMWLPLLLSVVTAYLLGSLDFAIIFTKLIKKEDIRERGSGNAGATNVLRSHGVGMAALTTLGDVLKSAVSVLIAQYVWYPLFDCGDYTLYGAWFAGLFAVLGHMYPLYFGFRGGKGVLTVLGMLLVIDWPVALIGLGTFIVVVLLSRMVSLGSITAGVALCIALFVKAKYLLHLPMPEVIFMTAMLVFIVSLAIMKHASNIKRIMNGTESKFGSKKKDESK